MIESDHLDLKENGPMSLDTEKHLMSNKALRLNATAARTLVQTTLDNKPVDGFTHNYYRYPARFSPQFVRGMIEAFTKPGDVILDPFMGGATTLVEAKASGRHAIGCDISSLSVFLAQVKTTLLTDHDLRLVKEWTLGLSEHLNLHASANRATRWHQDGYQRHLPWPMRKTLEMALARLNQLPRTHQQQFARCLLLKVGQWALDCRERIPSAVAFREKLLAHLNCSIDGMREFRESVRQHPPPDKANAISISLHCPAADLQDSKAFDAITSQPKLVVTSPPYPGVYVLYHRWKVRGRKESPAPFWVADCQDGRGQSHYCFGDRKQRGLKSYFDGIRSSFTGVRQVIHPNALVVQMVAFAEPKWQIPRFMGAMNDAGFGEVMPEELGISLGGRLWRSVPGRRWFALIQGPLATSKEVVLFHRPC